MNAAFLGAAMVVATRLELRLVARFRALDAVGPTTAVSAATIDPLARFGTRRAWRRLVRAGAVREVGGGCWYLDEFAFDRLRSRRRRLALTLLVLGAVVGWVIVVVARG